ncbi:MAG: RHS repeat-associated core domain-containing protein [Dokdonella sp.]|nr:RHS repeat-associated core domain-containing protein [Dokdonella sp.]
MNGRRPHLGSTLCVSCPAGGAGGTTTVRYQHTDGVGSPTAETDASGTLITGSRQLHEPYGLVSVGTPTQGPGFTGHVYDAQTGIYYMQQRYYDPVAGRFLSVDQVGPEAATGANFNRYWYANNNPYKNIDPDGRRACGKDTTCRLAQGERGGTLSINPATAGERFAQAQTYMRSQEAKLSNPYSTSGDAKKAFGRSFARKSKELGVEFGANIITQIASKGMAYVLTDFQISAQFLLSGEFAGYGAGVPIPGRPGDPSYWGFVHTHWANDGGFSRVDIQMLIDRQTNGYVIFPDETSRSFDYGKYRHNRVAPSDAYKNQSSYEF